MYCEKIQNKQYQLVIFDMDGVLVNSEPVHYITERQLFDQFKVDITPEQHGEFVGRSLKELWEYIIKNYNVKCPLDEILKIHVERLCENIFKAKLPCIKDVDKLIDKFREKKIKIAVASSSPKQAVETITKEINLYDKFDFVIGGDCVEKSKPNPQILLNVCKEAGVDPKRALVIEDSTNGLKAANNAGIDCIGFSNPDSGNQNLETADLIVDSYQKLISILF